ncbi:MAG: pseudouridine synthase, partial [Schleiferiaceae bacterium]|nr:pseudouridine synthase [Schleiferiaceae bacterium]
MKLDILYEDNHLVIVNKRPGDLAQKDKTGDDSLIEKVGAYIAKKYNKPGKAYIGLPHRLDRPTSGIVVLCRTSKSLERMNPIFKNRQVKKTYWA